MATVRATSGSDADVDDGEATALAMRRRDRRRARASAGAVAITARRRARMKEAVVGDLAALARRRGTRGSARARATRECASDDEDERNRVGRALEESGRGGGGGADDAGRRRALEERLRKMRALPRGSRYAKQQCELIEKALEILKRGKMRGARSVEEEDELVGLLKAVKL